MTPGTLILLPDPDETVDPWAGVPVELRASAVEVPSAALAAATGMHYVVRASLFIAAAAPRAPLTLVGRGGAGPLLPAIAAAQRAAHRRVGGYVFLDAALPGQAHGHDHHGAAAEPAGLEAIPAPVDWPDAPCGYLRTSEERIGAVRQARLRGWRVAEPVAGAIGAADISAGRIDAAFAQLLEAL